MFTGIVQATCLFKIITQKSDLLVYAIQLSPKLISNLSLGASVSVSGICQTVVKIDLDANLAYFEAIAETLSCTTLNDLKTNDWVNIERSLKFGDEVGGHLLSGHIIDTVKINQIQNTPTHIMMTFEVNPKLLKYILHKGYVALDGCSLTVVNPNLNTATFDVCLIPETIKITTFGTKKIGDRVNLEIDNQTQIIVHTVENYLKTDINHFKQRIIS